jgi:hypothetical protein
MMARHRDRYLADRSSRFGFGRAEAEADFESVSKATNRILLRREDQYD